MENVNREEMIDGPRTQRRLLRAVWHPVAFGNTPRVRRVLRRERLYRHTISQNALVSLLFNFNGKFLDLLLVNYTNAVHVEYVIDAVTKIPD